MEFIDLVWAALVGSAATIVASQIVKFGFDGIIKIISVVSKRFAKWIEKRRKERFNSDAADLFNKINTCQESIDKLSKGILEQLQQDLSFKFELAMKTKDIKDINSFFDTYNNFIEIGGKETVQIAHQRRVLETNLACRSGAKKSKDDDGSTDF